MSRLLYGRRYAEDHVAYAKHCKRFLKVNSFHGRFHVFSWDIPNGFVGLNKVVLDEAIKNGAVQGDGKKIKIVKFGTSIDSLFSKLQILEPVGHY